MAKAALYICTRVSEAKRETHPRNLEEWTVDARAGEIVPSHKFQILGYNEPCRVA